MDHSQNKQVPNRKHSFKRNGNLLL